LKNLRQKFWLNLKRLLLLLLKLKKLKVKLPAVKLKI
jgi:hypothetical protein